MIRLLKSCEPSRRPASQLPKRPARMCPRARAGARLHERRAPAAQWLRRHRHRRHRFTQLRHYGWNDPFRLWLLGLNRKASDIVHTCGIQVALVKLSILEEGTETFPNARKNCKRRKNVSEPNLAAGRRLRYAALLIAAGI